MVDWKVTKEEPWVDSKGRERVTRTIEPVSLPHLSFLGPGEWQPIGTAPRDGTWVLAHSHEWKLPEVVCWSFYSKRWQNMETSLFYQPAYWMELIPLPAPPKELLNGK